jgi:lysophospholipase L1-like esterase
MVAINRKIIILIVLYIIIIHCFIVIALMKTDIIHKVAYKIGLELTNFEFSEYYNVMLTYQISCDKKVPIKSIIFYGDSIIQGLCVNAISCKGVNFGIAGDTTYGLRQRINKYQSIISADAVVISIGINDIIKNKPKEIIIDNYKKILNNIPENIPVIINAILPIDEQNRKKLNSTIKNINSELYKLSKTSEKYFFNDASDKLINYRGNLSSVYHVGDGLHLNKKGYEILITSLEDTLALALNPSSSK